MNKAKQIFSTSEAADYCSLSVAGIKYHIYVSRRLKPDDRVGKALYFTRATLNRFKRGRGK